MQRGKKKEKSNKPEYWFTKTADGRMFVCVNDMANGLTIAGYPKLAADLRRRSSSAQKTLEKRAK